MSNQMSSNDVAAHDSSHPSGPGAKEGFSALGMPETKLRRFVRRFLSQRLAVAALLVLLGLAVVAILAPVIAPYSPNAQDLANTMADPGTPRHLLGTDELGRDTLSRLIFATRVALLAAAQVVFVSLAIGVIPGIIAGYFGGKTDGAISRVTETVMSFPPLILAIALVGVLGPGLTNAMIALGVIFAPTLLRIARAAALEVKAEDYILASESIGTPSSLILRRHVIPNIMPPILVQTALVAGFALIAESGLSFLGLGVRPPDASWGTMIGRGYQSLHLQPWLVIFPGMAIAVTVLALNVLGDGLRDSIGQEFREQ